VVTLRRLLLIAAPLLILGLAWTTWNWRTSHTNDPEASFQRGLTAIKSHDIVTLHHEIQILKRFPLYTHQMQLLRGAVLLTGRDDAAALAEFAACSHDPQTQVLALTLAGETLCRLEQLSEAIKVLERAAALDPTSIETFRWLAIAYYDTGANTPAVVALKKIIELDDQDYRPHRLLGLIQKDRARYTEAVQEYRACLRLKPADESVRDAVLCELSDCLTRLNQFDEALRFLDKAPETADTRAIRANCYFAQGNRSEARKSAERVVELDPNHIEGRGWLAKLDLEAGHFQAAADNLELIIAKYPAEFAPRFKLAQAYQRLQRKPEAEIQLVRAKELQTLSQKFTELHDKANATPKDASIRFELGETAQQLNRIELARMWYQATLAIDPKFVKAKLALEKLPKQQGTGIRGTRRKSL
jgi:tetratricopeptide (TPR) repeat protein